MSVLALARPEIVSLQPYASARVEADGGEVMLNANELPWLPPGSTSDPRSPPLNRYPDPQPRILVERLAGLYAVDDSQVLVGRGSDEAIDLLIRAFCRPGRDAVAVCPPTFGMYAISAAVHGAAVVEWPLTDAFEVDAAHLVANLPASVKIVFLCSPNNPTGGLVAIEDVESIAAALAGRALVVVDEAYIEFAAAPSAAGLLRRHSNLCVLRTLSKAWGLAGARVGCLLAAAEIVALLRRIMAPYPLPTPSITAALAALTADGLALTAQRAALVVSERERMATELARLPNVERVLASRANFLCVAFDESTRVQRDLLAAGVIVRDVGRYPRLAGFLRISIGRREENARVLELLIRREYGA